MPGLTLARLFSSACHHALAAVAMVIALGQAPAAAQNTVETYGGRAMIVHVPAQVPPQGTRALVIVLHGGLGNADRIASKQAESGLNMNTVADRDGFIVAYLNGTPVTRRLGAKFLGWNAGGDCCGQSAANNVDDVGYIQGAVAYLADRYGIDRGRVFGMGHSNGAMMAQRLICESDVLAAAVAISGPLNLPVSHCPTATGRRVLAIHGADDRNVPIQGGRGRGLADVAFSSEERAHHVMTESGAVYDLQIIPGADHFLNHIDDAILKRDRLTIADKAAVFFGLARH